MFAVAVRVKVRLSEIRLGSSLVVEWNVTAVAKSSFGCAHSKEPRVKVLVFVSGWEVVDRNQESQEF